ncbi:MAG: hypothetical protein IJE59_02380 [Clostridia bacterium]|nr:hypothetical protein [Clostridia bacterium]
MYAQSLYSESASMSSVGSMSNAGGMPTANMMSGTSYWLIISAVLAVIVGLVLYFTFLRKKNDGKFTGFLGWVYDFWNFKKLSIEAILKITYLILSLFITLASFSIIPLNFGGFLLALILGNLVLRLTYEFSLIMILICRNTTEINSKLNKKD